MTKYNSVIAQILDGAPRSEVVASIMEDFSVKRTRANDIYRECQRSVETSKAESSDDPSGLVITNKYTYNKISDKYIINLKCRVEPLILSGSRHRAICRDYSAWNEDLSSNEICLKYSLTPEIFNEYRRIFNLTKDREPLSAEEIIDQSVDDSVEAILEQKRYSVYSEFQKQDWKETQKDALKWRSLQANTFDTTREVLESWSFPAAKKLISPKSSGDYSMVIGANDWHIGECFDPSVAYSGSKFNSDIAARLIDSYSGKIKGAVEARKYKFNSCYCVLNGDILNSAWDGKTVKGTQIHSDKVNEDMFEAAFSSTVRFISNLASIFPSVNVIIVPGNHDGPLLTILGTAIEAYFRLSPQIRIHNSKKWADIFRIGNVAMLVTHGGAIRVKSSLPTGPAKLKSYLQDMWAAHPEKIRGCTSKIVVSGHFHRFWQQDMGHFDFYCLGGLPLGDSYADELNLRSRPRQNCIILDNNNVIETLHFYFD